MPFALPAVTALTVGHASCTAQRAVHVRARDVPAYRSCLLCEQACPVKDEFDRKARDYVGELEWVKEVRLGELEQGRGRAALAHGSVVIM